MVFQYRALWSTTGGAGYSVFHARTLTGAGQGTAQSFADGVAALFAAISGTTMPSDVTISYDGEVVDLDTSTGELQAVYAVTPPASKTFTATGGYAAPAGGRIDWTTEAIVNGRRLRGRTYIVPLASTNFEADGSITAGAITTLSNGANAYLTAAGGFADAEAAVWSRPVYEGEAPNRVLVRGGTVADITGFSIPDSAAVLRSRRD
jgi:hypothetical protein